MEFVKWINARFVFVVSPQFMALPFTAHRTVLDSFDMSFRKNKNEKCAK